jgi:hypothetical protein
MSPSLNRILATTVAAMVLATSPATTRAQDGTVRGVVADSTGAPIGDADVSIVALHQLTRTDAQGRFMFTKLPRGEHEVTVRRLGYMPEMVKVIINELAYSYNITLSRQATTIAGVDVNEVRMKGRGIEEFYRRRSRGAGGNFFTRDDIQKRNARRTTDVIRGTPGITFVRGGIRFLSARGQCTPVIWLDGQSVEGMELDNIPVTDIEGIELYSGPSTVPMQFAQKWAKEACGTIVVWTRIPGTP